MWDSVFCLTIADEVDPDEADEVTEAVDELLINWFDPPSLPPTPWELLVTLLPLLTPLFGDGVLKHETTCIISKFVKISSQHSDGNAF